MTKDQAMSRAEHNLGQAWNREEGGWPSQYVLTVDGVNWYITDSLPILAEWPTASQVWQQTRFAEWKRIR